MENLPLMNRKASKDREFELIQGASQGDEEAFRQLYDITHKKIYFYLYRLLKDRETAEDIMVETYTEAWRGAKNFRGDSRVTTWIMSIARNLAMNHFKKVKPHDNIDDFPSLSNNIMPDAEPLDRQRLLKEAISRLSTKHGEILDMVFFHEMTYQEVSEVLRIPVSTVKTRVFYAKDGLRDVLNNMGVSRNDI